MKNKPECFSERLNDYKLTSSPFLGTHLQKGQVPLPASQPKHFTVKLAVTSRVTSNQLEEILCAWSPHRLLRSLNTQVLVRYFLGQSPPSRPHLLQSIRDACHNFLL